MISGLKSRRMEAPVAYVLDKEPFCEKTKRTRIPSTLTLQAPNDWKGKEKRDGTTQFGRAPSPWGSAVCCSVAGIHLSFSRRHILWLICDHWTLESYASFHTSTISPSCACFIRYQLAALSFFLLWIFFLSTWMFNGQLFYLYAKWTKEFDRKY